MDALTEGMRRVIRERRLGFVATVCAEGTPNLSLRGTTYYGVGRRPSHVRHISSP